MKAGSGRHAKRVARRAADCSDRDAFDPGLLVVRRSSIDGFGAFAARRIRKGARVIEYAGERLSCAQLDTLYDSDTPESRHTFVFHVDGDLYIDGARGGNDARFINHSCDPNCEAYVDDGRIFFRAIRNIQPGTELTCDYSLQLEDEPLPSWEQIYACRCGAARCRGTMLDLESESSPHSRR